MIRIALAFSCACLLLTGLACVSTEESEMAELLEEEKRLRHGPTTWEAVEQYLRTPENVAVNKHKPGKAILLQTRAMPSSLDAAHDGATTDLTPDDVTENLFKDIKDAYAMAEGDLPNKDMVDLKQPALGILLHSRELVTVFNRRVTSERVLKEIMGKKRQEIAAMHELPFDDR